jgi:hypothetical protein
VLGRSSTLSCLLALGDVAKTAQSGACLRELGAKSSTASQDEPRLNGRAATFCVTRGAAAPSRCVTALTLLVLDA